MGSLQYAGALVPGDPRPAKDYQILSLQQYNLTMLCPHLKGQVSMQKRHVHTASVPAAVQHAGAVATDDQHCILSLQHCNMLVLWS